jgi:hypothetical protein
MQVRIYLGDSEDENYVLKAFHEGSGGKLVTLDEYEPSEIAVVFGTYKKKIERSFKRGAVIAEQKKLGLDTIIIETGYLNRGSGKTNHYAVGLNGINGRADFKNRNSPYNRAEKLGVIPGEWRRGDHIVLCGQVPWDASVDFSNHQDWLNSTVRGIFLRTDRNVIFRPHPLCKLSPINGTVYSTRSLENDLKHAHCCVTFNSNSGVEAVVDGVPTLSFDIGSMVYEVSGHLLDDIEEPKRFDRTQWLANLCHAQWTPEEMKNGETWDHLKLNT